MKWLIGLLAVLVVLGGVFWWAVLDAGAPTDSDGAVDLAGLRAAVAEDAADTLPTDVRVEFVGESEAPAFAAEAGNFSGERTFAYVTFQVVAPGGDTLIDGAVDQDTINQMTDGEGRFDEAAYQRVLDASESAANVLITHEHLDHVMAFARHPAPEAIAPRLRLTRAQLDGLPEHAPGGVLAPVIADLSTLDLSAPSRIAPGISAMAAPGHSPGTILIYVRGGAREYLFIGDIAWMQSSVEHARGRPRFIRWIMPGVDPDRAAVLRQLRALHDIAAAEPDLVIVPAHDAAYLHGLVESGALESGISALEPAPEPAPATE